MCLVYFFVLLTCISVIAEENSTPEEDLTTLSQNDESTFEPTTQTYPTVGESETESTAEAEAEPESTSETIPQSNFNPQLRIVGGDIVTDRSRFAYQASMRYNLRQGSFHFCGATIIDPFHLLTAAHCVFNEKAVADPSTIIVVVGDLNTRQEIDSTIYRSLSAIIPHPEYSDTTFQSDIAILRVSQRLPQWTNQISYLPLSTATPPDKMSCLVSGWGTTSADGSASDVLRYVAVPIVSRRTCVARYGSAITAGMLCAGFMEGGRDACQGDSGGPLVCDNTLAGVVSWGYSCAAPGFPGVYADVALYKEWIESELTVVIETEEPVYVDVDNGDEEQARMADPGQDSSASRLSELSILCILLKMCSLISIT